MRMSKLRESKYDYIILAMIVLSLLSNVFFCLWDNVFALFSLESFFDDMYFLSIVGCVMTRHLQKSIANYETYRVVYIGILLINGLLFFMIFVSSLILGKSRSCQCISENINRNLVCRCQWGMHCLEFGFARYSGSQLA